MKIFLLSTLFCCITSLLNAQNTLKAVIKTDQGPLAGASIFWKEGAKGIVADTTGLVVLPGMPNGKQTFVVSYVGMQDKTISYTFPLATDDVVEIELEEAGHEDEEEVIVTTTRTSRTILNTPTRVEIISGEELEEKGNMKPGDIRMLLNESTGIQTQQTSATSYNSSIRIQGLDGRYTQILRDGFPLYAGFSGGLSIMQIAPLDLRPVEVIKGSSSTLYGGGAIAGLVNLVSKTPGDKREISFLANGTTAGGLDLSGFYSQRFSKVGVTVFGSRNSNKAFDPANIGLTAIPEFSRYTINPRLFLYGKKLNANIGFSYITEDRIGGNVDFIKGKRPTGYFEKNESDRFTTQLDIRYQMAENTTFNLRNSYSRFDRRLSSVTNYAFEGVQQSSFSELSLNYNRSKSQWIVGLNFLSDDFNENTNSNLKRDYDYNTYGAFIQNTWQPVEKFTLETGLRGDYVSEFGFELLPRFSAMYRFTPALTLRLGGGAGYKTPTVFNEESERLQFRSVLPIDVNRTENERSIGGNFDINYRTSLGEVGFSINQLFFYTKLNKPLVLFTSGFGNEFKNAEGHIDTKGMETNIKFTYADFKLFIGYTYADVETNFNGVKEWFPLTAKHRLNNVLMYEIEEKLKLGLEAYYFSPQRLNDNTKGKPYWIAGFMAEKIWERFSVYINFENFTNTRQSRFDTIYTGNIDNPIFRDIYAPVEGFVVNGGIKIKL